MRRIVFLLLLLPSIAVAWSSTGHVIVCEIAFQELNADARHEVTRLIGLDSEFSTFAESCRWADSLEERSSDHYLNMPRSSASITVEECPLADRCVLSAIRDDVEILSDGSQSDSARLDALKLVGHWVGDIHQPLHISFEDDRGANYIDAAGMCRGTLHGVWDGCILARQLGKDASAIANDLLASVTEEERRSWQSTAAIVWANESFQITLSPQTGYCTMKDDGCWYWPFIRRLEAGNLQREMIITQDYLSANQEIVERRLKQAGIRLAAVLNQALPTSGR